MTVALPLYLDQVVEPGTDGSPAVARAHRGEHPLGVVEHDGTEEVGAIVEDVVQLPLAHAGTVDYVVEAGGGDPLFGDQLGRRGENPFARRPSPGGLG